MTVSTSLVTLFLAGVAYAAPAAFSNATIPAAVAAPHSTALSSNATKTSGQIFHDIASIVDVNNTMNAGTNKFFY
jgi:hypothetical protein